MPGSAVCFWRPALRRNAGYRHQRQHALHSGYGHSGQQGLEDRSGVGSEPEPENELRFAQGPGRPDRQKLNPSALDDLATRLKKELAAREVSHHVCAATARARARGVRSQTVSGTCGAASRSSSTTRDRVEGNGGVDVAVLQNSFVFGLVSDGDSLDERYAGISARYENRHVGSDGWTSDSSSTASTTSGTAARWARWRPRSKQTSDAYRTRQNFQPR